ncbi:MAG: hypothetical protein FWG90_00030 [Oscillospiraceae bacterium]|nr:hypothetical protein [Oscillospiraceae bacterium]
MGKTVNIDGNTIFHYFPNEHRLICRDSVRKHWSIENQLHWHLDITFGEDNARLRKDNSPLNWNVLCQTALPVLKNADVGKKQSIKYKMFIAALDISVLENIIFLR